MEAIIAKISPYAFFQELDNNGDPLAGGQLFTYESGTVVNKQTFTTEDESTPNTNPVILDAAGRADIWLGTGSYTFLLKDSDDVTISTVDDIVGDASGALYSTVVSVSTNTAIVADNQNNLIECTAALTLSLLSATVAESGFAFSVKNSGSSDVVIDPDAAELIDGASTLTIAAGLSALIVSDGTGWISSYLDTVTLAGDNTFTGKTAYADDGELTIATGVITITGTNHTIDTESDAASDDLDTINGGTNGEIVILRAENAARTVVIKDGTGNIETPFGGDITLDETEKVVLLEYDLALTKWLVISAPQEEAADATTTVSGVVEVATQAEIEAETATGGTGASLVATPATLNFNPGVAKVWVDFNSAGTIAASHNTTSITDSAVGKWVVNFATDFGSANYSWAAASENSNDSEFVTADSTVGAKAAGSIGITNWNQSGTPNDADGIVFTAWGTQ